MTLYGVIAALIMGGYFYRLARIYNQNQVTWAIAGAVSFFVGEIVWYFVFTGILLMPLLRILPSFELLGILYTITMILAGVVVSLWTRNYMIRTMTPVQATQQAPGA